MRRRVGLHRRKQAPRFGVDLVALRGAQWPERLDRQHRALLHAIDAPGCANEAIDQRDRLDQPVDAEYAAAVRVVDYSDSEALYTANHHTDDFSAPAYWQIDILGSIQWAASQLYRLKPGVKVTFDNFHYINLVTGQQLTVINPDMTRTYVGIYLHENRLYVLDATVARNAPAPIAFQQSLEFLDAEGKSVRYRTYYFDKLPEAKLGRRGAGQGTQGPAPDPGAPANGGQGGRGRQ